MVHFTEFCPFLSMQEKNLPNWCNFDRCGYYSRASFHGAGTVVEHLRQKPLTPPQTETTQYSEFLSLCQHVDCLVEKSMERMNSGGGLGSRMAAAAASDYKKDDMTKKSIDDDMRLRSLRDSNRKPIIKPLHHHHQTSTTTNNHYLWKSEHSSRDDKYKSRFHPMRNW